MNSQDSSLARIRLFVNSETTSVPTPPAKVSDWTITAGRFFPRVPDGCGNRTKITSPRFMASPDNHRTPPSRPSQRSCLLPRPRFQALLSSTGCRRIPPPSGACIRRLELRQTSPWSVDLRLVWEYPCFPKLAFAVRLVRSWQSPFNHFMEPRPSLNTSTLHEFAPGVLFGVLFQEIVEGSVAARKCVAFMLFTQWLGDPIRHDAAGIS